MKRLGRLLAQWHRGRPYRFPACCQAHYLLDVLRGRTPAGRRGTVDYGPGNEYVPCAICMHRPGRWQRPMTLGGPLTLPRYVTWEQSCAEIGIPARVARGYVR